MAPITEDLQKLNAAARKSAAALVEHVLLTEAVSRQLRLTHDQAAYLLGEAGRT